MCAQNHDASSVRDGCRAEALGQCEDLCNYGERMLSLLACRTYTLGRARIVKKVFRVSSFPKAPYVSVCVCILSLCRSHSVRDVLGKEGGSGGNTSRRWDDETFIEITKHDGWWRRSRIHCECVDNCISMHCCARSHICE